MKFFKKMLSATLAASLVFSSFVVYDTTIVSAAPSISAGWNETLYAEWKDSNPDSDAVKVGYKLSTDSEYTYLSGNDHEFLIRPASTSGYGRVDIPGIKAGRYDIEITASDGTVHTRKGIKVYAYDRSGYAHFNNTSGVGAYNDDGTPKENAIIIYVTEENKDTVEIPGYEGHDPVAYMSSTSGATWTRGTAGVGNILNNNHKYIREVTGTDNHPLIFRFVGEVTPPENLTPYDTKTNELGGSKGDNGNLAITKYAKNITIEGIGDDATINGWGFTFSQTSTCPSDTGENLEVRNLTFKNYTEDALGFQGDDGITCPIKRVWVHNNVFYPGYCANPAESDKADGDGSCDFKRGQYYTMSYNHYIKCHKTNLLGASGSNYQYNMSLHHNWYEQVAARQPLGASGNAHIYNTYFDNSTGTTIDLRGVTSYFLENNYLENCKESYKSRNNTSNMKIYGDIVVDSGVKGGSKETIKGTKTVVTSRDASGLPDNGLTLIDGTNAKDFDTNSTEFYYDAASKQSNVEVMNAAEDVPEYVKTYAGVLKAFPETESGEVIVTVSFNGEAVKDAAVTASGLTFKNNSDGTYTATAALGAEYEITVSKEGYSNVKITTTPIETDGEIFKGEAKLVEDVDGFAAVKLTGGTDEVAVKGATVTLADGTELKDQGDGTYVSANQLAVGTYKATITNTGDYIAPTSAQDVIVKTTDAATEIHLDKIKGKVSVSLEKAEGETKDLDASTASVYVGTTALTYAGNNTFEGEVDINTAYEVSVKATGWSVDSISSSKITATKDTEATAKVTLKAKGDLYTWNYTEGTNTEEFFNVSSESAWSSAAKNPQTYDDESLTAAIKMNSSVTITFDAPADGELVLVMDAKDGSSVYLNDVSYSVTTGINKIPVSAGTNVLKKNKNESHLYLLQYGVGSVDTDNTSTGTTTTTTTETTTEVTTNATPVELGEAVTNSGSNISVVYNASTDTWTLTDTSSDLAAELTIPFDKITSGKVVVKGTASPSTASGKWSLVRVNGTKADGTTGEIAALATDSNKKITLRTGGSTYATSSVAVTANQTYNYEFVIDLDAKTVQLKIDDNTYEGTIDATEVSGFYAVTSASGSRNLVLSNPYVAVVKDEEETNGLSDQVMWSMEENITEGTNGLEIAETMYANEEESNPAVFTDGENTYELTYFLQQKTNPYNEAGVNPMTGATGGKVPVTGAFIKFTPEKNSVFTAAVKTNGGKITYVTDETGAIVTTIDNTDNSTTYDIIRFNAYSGKSYYLYSGASKICYYYLGYTEKDDLPDPEVPVEEEVIKGDADGNGKIEANDATVTLEKANNLDFVLAIESKVKEIKDVIDVDGNGKIEANDAALILQKSLNLDFQF